jgi:hypothetical protein
MACNIYGMQLSYSSDERFHAEFSSRKRKAQRNVVYLPKIYIIEPLRKIDRGR